MTDAHCHPWDLKNSLLNFMLEQDAETERRKCKTTAAASATSREQFEYHEELAKKAVEDGVEPLYCCYALHPQLSPVKFDLTVGLAYLNALAKEGRLNGVGETGFDLYNETYKASEKIQDEMFAGHLETALNYGLPLILHVRRAMHKIFPFARELKKLPAVIFHSWPGSRGEGEALVNRGINVFFSFGTTVLKNHREAMASAAIFPSERILLETDAPWQPLRGKEFSSYGDLEAICTGIAALRKEAGSPCNTMEELEQITTANFFRCFG